MEVDIADGQQELPPEKPRFPQCVARVSFNKRRELRFQLFRVGPRFQQQVSRVQVVKYHIRPVLLHPLFEIAAIKGNKEIGIEVRRPTPLPEDSLNEKILRTVELDPDAQNLMKRRLMAEYPFCHLLRDHHRPGPAERGSGAAFYKLVVEQLEKRGICRAGFRFIIGLWLAARLTRLNEGLILPEEIEDDDPGGLLYPGEVLFQIPGHHRGLRREPVFFSARDENGPHLVQPPDIFPVGIITQLIMDEQHDQHAANQPDGEAENVDDRNHLVFFQPSPGYLEIIAEHGVNMAKAAKLVKNYRKTYL